MVVLKLDNVEFVGGSVNSKITTAITEMRPLPSAFFIPYARNLRSFGDSITNGYGLATPATQAWPILVGSSLGGLTVQNLGTSGESITDCLARIISWNTSSHDPSILNTLMIGTNDMNGGNNTSYIESAIMACALWLGCSNSQIKKPDDAGITYSGTWIQGPAYGAIFTKKTITTNSSFSCSINGSIGYILYAQYSTQVEVPENTVEISIDNGPFIHVDLVKPTVNAQSYSFGPGVIRLHCKTEGLHSISLRVTSATSNGFMLVGVISDGVATETLPAVIIGTMPIRQSVPVGDESYRRASYSAIRKLIADRWNICGINMANVLATTDFGDEFHPNVAGHVKIAERFTAAAKNSLT